MLNIDLHSHSTVSDGLLSPEELMQRAASRGVCALALTDHDDIGGLSRARDAAYRLGIHFINGVEISVSRCSQTLHIVGLRINPEYPALLRGLEVIRLSRAGRAQRIAAELEKSGIRDSLAGAARYAGNPNLIGRAHFARFLVERGIAEDVKSVFQKFLKRGKPGYVEHRWVSLAEAVTWITASGGIAVLAHPGRYPVSATQMQQLLGEFKELGGAALEVVSGSHTSEQYAVFARYSKQFDLLASVGSDFHGPGESRRDVGQLPELPDGCVPVWELWSDSKSDVRAKRQV
ncbi:MAG TPA: 3',5'-nucleoside bisphosphate phosphatase [Burkholderiales bacterium]|nr:3',5'-nucleoside bisphosphate phosphatase [Burkholderiales bacterium]